MELHKLTDELAVTGQIEPGDISELAAQGIRAIICNRPDGEASGQPGFHELEQAAREHGVQIVYQPVVSGQIGEDDVKEFDQALQSLPKPIVAFCRSGTRSTALWSLSQAGKQPIEDILTAAREAGYDMRPLIPRLQMHR
ncbi:MAG TPA: TIGR01244 family sulfur transferase [Hyphomicrobiales bacterium]|nr:TIGR01244 family sulfur transferase [Hyphomicrobiales bacterium]